MKGKLASTILLALGALLIIAGLVVKFLVVPSLAKFPDDVDSTRTYAGTVDILNRAELESPTGAPLFFTGLPVIFQGIFGAHELFHIAVLGGLGFHWHFIARSDMSRIDLPGSE